MKKEAKGFLRRHRVLTIVLMLLISPILLVFLYGFWVGFSGYASQGDPIFHIKVNLDLDANAYFTGTEFYISNNEKDDCQDSEITINKKYKLDHKNIAAKKEYHVGASQFTLDDGTRFNHFATKPLDIKIICKGNNNLSSKYYVGTF